MFVIWGVGSRRNYTNVIKRETCDRCGVTSDINIIADYKCGTIFFIPVFKFGKKYFEVCPNCGAFKEISKREFKEIKLANRKGLVFESNDVAQINAPVQLVKSAEVEEVSEVKISKEDVTKEINVIIKKLKEREYVLTAEKLDKFKLVLKGQLMKKFADETIVDEAIADYFKNV